MSRLNVAGGETGNVAEIGVGGTAVAIESSITDGSAYSWKLNPLTTDGASIRFGLRNGATDLPALNAATIYAKANIRPFTLPASGTEQFAVVTDTGGNVKFSLRFDASGHILAYNSAGALLATGTSVVPTDVFTCIEFSVGKGTNAAWAVRINAAAEISGTGDLLDVNNGWVYLGKYANISGQSVVYYFDSVAIDNADWPGKGYVKNRKPTGDAEVGGNWHTDTGATTGLSARLDEIPTSDVDYVAYYDLPAAPDVAVSLFLANIETCASLSVTGTIKSITPWAYIKSATGAFAASLVLKTTGAGVSGLSYDAELDAGIIGSPLVLDPATSAAWTLAGAESAQVGLQNDSLNPTVTRDIAALGVLVEYLPTPTPADSDHTFQITAIGHPKYGALLEYYRDDAWHDMSERLVTRTTTGESLPISVSKGYRKIYTASLALDNTDGLLTPENESSAYNLNGASAYDPLIDEARKVRLKQGIYAYPLLSGQKTVVATPSPSVGTSDELTDNVYATDYTDKTDAAFVVWSTLASGATIVLTVDLGSAQTIRYGVLSFLSKSLASPQIELPSTVQFAYSTDNATWTNIDRSAFDMSEYSDARQGQNYLAWFTDVAVSARYVRATITNIAEENEVYIDEFSVYGGATASIITKTVITGYLGDDIDEDTNPGYIHISFEDVRKKENDNRRCELTPLYKDSRPEEIIYDLLTNQMYWSPDRRAQNNRVTNGGFEAGTGGTTITGWTLGGATFRDNWATPIGSHSGTWHAHLNAINDTLAQSGLAVTGGSEHVVEYWVRGANKLQLYTLTISYDSGSPESFNFFVPGGGQQFLWAGQVFTAPAAATTATITFLKESNGTLALDDVSMDLLKPASTLPYDLPLVAADIGWTRTQNLSGFEIPEWQGQQGTILDYINELAELIGWVYDADGDGVRQFWEPDDSRDVANAYMNYWPPRMKTARRRRTGRDIRNVIVIVGYEAGNREVTHRFRNEASITKYGERYGRWTEPLVKSKDAAKFLGKSLLRDLAWAGKSVSAEIQGNWDIDRPTRVCTFHESVRALLTKAELWWIESWNTQMTCSGRGTFDGSITGRKYVSSVPNPVANVAGTGAATSVAVAWDANTEGDIDGYYLYWSTAADGDFTKRAKVTAVTDTVTGLVNNTGYWFYVTAVNINAVESEPSCLIYCKAGIGNSGTENTTWGIADLAATLTDNTSYIDLDLAWTPSLTFDPDSIVVTVMGPDIATAPTNPSEHASPTPANAVAEHVYTRYRDVDFDAGTTYYWRFAIQEIVINDKHYHMGAPLYSNTASAAWPA